MEQDELGRYIGKGMLKLLGLDVAFLMEDSLYMMKRQDHWVQHAEKIGELRERFRNSMIAGGAFGLALIFSLRRYFPNHFSSFTANRLIIESFVLGGSFFGSSISVLLGAANFVHAVKKDYVLKADPHVYRYLSSFKQKYQVDEETQIRYLLSTEEFEEWKKYRHHMMI